MGAVLYTLSVPNGEDKPFESVERGIMLQIIILSFKGIRGRGRQSLLLLIVITFVFAFIVAVLCYLESTKTAEIETRYNLYGRWQIAQYGLSEPEANEFVSISHPDFASAMTQLGAIVGDAYEQLGSIGFVDDAFLEMGRITLLSGRLPETKDEIALTANLLDGIGYSYELGQTVTFKTAPPDYLAGVSVPSEIQTISFILCGILPSYETYWNTGINLPLNAMVTRDAELPEQWETLTHMFCVFISNPVNDVGLRVLDGTGVYNEAAYPDGSTEETLSVMLIAGALLFLVFAVTQLFFSTLGKRTKQMGILSAIGASRAWVLTLCMWEAVFYLFVALPAGALLGVALCFAGLLTQGAVQFFTVPAGRLAFCLFLCLFGLLTGFFLPALRQTFKRADNTSVLQKSVRHRKKIGLALPLLWGETALVSLCFILTLFFAGLAYWHMMPYYVNRDLAAINVRAKMEQSLTPELLDDLLSLPGVREISALSHLEVPSTVSSEKIAESRMLQAIYKNPSIDNTGWMMVEANTYNTWFVAPWQPDLDALAAACEEPINDMEVLHNGDSVLIYSPYYTWVPEEEQYDFFSIHSGEDLTTATDTELAAGQTVTISAIEVMRDDEGKIIRDKDGNIMEYKYSKSVQIAGIIREFPSGFLMTNNYPLTAGTVFFSQSLHREMYQTLFFPNEIASGYSSVNIRFDGNASYAVRRAIALIVQKRNGLITANTYELVEQHYKSGMQRMFLFGVAGVLLCCIGLLLIQNIFLAKLEAERSSIGLLTAIGMEWKRFSLTYFQRGLILSGIGIIVATTLALLAQMWVKRLYLAVKLIEIFEPGDWEKAMSVTTYPWAVHFAVCTVIAGFILCVHIVSPRSILKKTPIENMNGF